MREIKFRLFGKNSKEFLSPENVGLNLKELQNVCDIDLWHVMQFTGLINKKALPITVAPQGKPLDIAKDSYD